MIPSHEKRKKRRRMSIKKGMASRSISRRSHSQTAAGLPLSEEIA
jgi:hypothetical protein